MNFFFKKKENIKVVKWKIIEKINNLIKYINFRYIILLSMNFYIKINIYMHQIWKNFYIFEYLYKCRNLFIIVPKTHNIKSSNDKSPKLLYLYCLLIIFIVSDFFLLSFLLYILFTNFYIIIIYIIQSVLFYFWKNGKLSTFNNPPGIYMVKHYTVWLSNCIEL